MTSEAADSPRPPAVAPADADRSLRDADLVEVVRAAVRGAAAKTLEETVVLDVGDLLGITDYFVVTSGRSSRQVRTIAEEVERAAQIQAGRGPARVEGLADASWALLDFDDVVVHVFDEAARGYYDLERLWADAPRLAWSERRLSRR